MADNLVSLADRRVEPVPEVLALLAKMQEMAEQGDIRGIVVATTNQSQCVGHAFELGDGGVAALVYAVESVKMALMAEGTT